MLKENFYHELQTEAQTACGWPVIGCAIFFHMAGKSSQNTLSAVTNARIAALHGLPVAPYPSRRRPFHSAKPRARHERQSCWPHQRQASVCGSAAALRSCSVPAVSPSPLHLTRSTADRSLVNLRTGSGTNHAFGLRMRSN